MRSLIALSLVGSLTAPAWARPDHDSLPPGAMRSEVQMRMPVDGRADTAAPPRDSRPEPWQRATTQEARPQQDRGPTQSNVSPVPFKSDVALKVQQGDHREMTQRPQALDAQPQAQKPASDRMGRPEQKPALPIKIDVMMKAQHGDDRNDSSSAPAASSASKSSKGPAQPQAQQRMTPKDREMLCRQVGLCLPQINASDDIEDKTE